MFVCFSKADCRGAFSSFKEKNRREKQTQLVTEHDSRQTVPSELLFVGCLTSQQHAIVSQGRICSDNCTCCHTDIEVADQTFHLIQSQYTDTGPTSPSTDPITPGAWQGSHWSANFEVIGRVKKSRRKRDSYPGSSALEADLTTRPTRRSPFREKQSQLCPPVLANIALR